MSYLVAILPLEGSASPLTSSFDEKKNISPTSIFLGDFKF